MSFPFFFARGSKSSRWAGRGGAGMDVRLKSFLFFCFDSFRLAD